MNFKKLSLSAGDKQMLSRSGQVSIGPQKLEYPLIPGFSSQI